jgi:hypothetical protein
LTRKSERNEFINKFETEGPGVEEDMDKGQKLMEVYAVEFEKLEATRLEMGKGMALIHKLLHRSLLAAF